MIPLIKAVNSAMTRFQKIKSIRRKVQSSLAKLMLLGGVALSGFACNKPEADSAALQTDKVNQATEKSKPAPRVAAKKAPVVIARNNDSEKVLNAARTRMLAMDYAEGFDIALYASEEQTQNPAFFTFDNKGDLYTTEILRMWHGTEDIRGHHHLIEQDIRIKTLDDRMAMMKANADKLPMAFYTEKADRVRTLRDTNNDGRADQDQLFVEALNDPLDGLASGLLAGQDSDVDGDAATIYLANIPHIWTLKDQDGDGVAEIREPLHSGFGTRFSFNGHDLHGLAWGPDGKIYWSLGDRGYNFVSREGKHFYGPNLGGVFRSNPDGSDIELFYTGLRNPQELVFDQYGELFTGDNDGDGGDVERVNYLVEGGDSGWHAGFQSIMSFAKALDLRSYKYAQKQSLFNPWMTQSMWKTRNDKQPAFILPGIAQLDGGPSGFTYNPGSAFGDALRNSFFLVLFKGAPSETYINRFTLEPRGASYELALSERFWGGFNAVDVEFGPDGKLYASEFNYAGWGPQDQGAFYTLSPSDDSLRLQAANDQKILLSDFSKKTDSALIDLLGYDHMRVRQRAQFALAKREGVLEPLLSLVQNAKQPELKRLHALWALAQFAANSVDASELLSADLLSLLIQQNSHVHLATQAAKIAGDLQITGAQKALVQSLTETQAEKNHKRAMYAAISLGKQKDGQAGPQLANLLQKNNGEDLWLRHAGVMYLANVEEEVRRAFFSSENRELRLIALLAYRKNRAAQLTQFLNDSDIALIDEAIFALHDLYPAEYQLQLAEYLPVYLEKLGSNNSEQASSPSADITIARLINANYRQGTAEAAQRLLAMLSGPSLSTEVVSEVLGALEAWEDVNGIDTLIGLPSRASKKRQNIDDLVQKAVPQLVERLKAQPLAQAIRLAKRYNYELPQVLLVKMVRDEANLNSVREQALSGLLAQNYSGIKELANELVDSNDPAIRAIGLNTLAEVDVEQLFARVNTLTNPKRAESAIDESYLDYQSSLKTLAAMLAGSSESAQNESKATKASIIGEPLRLRIKTIADKELAKLVTGSAMPQVMLEIRELVEALNDDALKAKLAAFDKAHESAAMQQQFADSMFGGSIEAGKAMFKSGGAGECMRCHIINWEGGNVGPDLSAIGETKDEAYILRSIVDPGSEIASGYGVMTITHKDGRTLSGTYLADTADEVTLLINDEAKTFARADLAKVVDPVSGMPPMQYFISRREIRDLVAYLASLKEQQGH